MPLYSTSPAAPVDPAKQALARFLNKRIVVRAEFSCYGDRHPVFAVQQVHFQGRLVADHIWIPCPVEGFNLRLWRGCPIQFEGRVIRYVKKNHPNLFCYGLDDIRHLMRLPRKQSSHD